MLKVERFINELMSSNCYLVYDEDTKRCLVIDPGSEKSLQEILFLEEKELALDYIILTHEHTDHNWGVNALRAHNNDAQLVCSEQCDKNIKKTSRIYFLFYYDDPDYRYEIANADVLISSEEQFILWEGNKIEFLLTPGHSYGSMCIKIDEMLFTGDTIMPFKPYFNGRDSNEDDWEKSITVLKDTISLKAMIYPGHGDVICFENWIKYYYK